MQDTLTHPLDNIRPPRLSHHFCAIELPFDLNEDVITGPVQDFEEAVAKLNGEGWSIDDVVHPATRQRYGLLVSPIREEAIELTNQPTTPDLEPRARYHLPVYDSCIALIVNLDEHWPAFRRFGSPCPPV